MKTLEEILSLEEDVDKYVKNLCLEFYDLVEANKLEEVKEFLKDYPVPEIFFEKCYTPYWDSENKRAIIDPVIALACAGIAYDKSKSFEMMEYFENLGLKANEVCFGYNALNRYIDRDGKNKEVIEYFFKKGCTFETYNEESGSTPLHEWILCGEEVKYLEEALKLGANPNMRAIKTESEFSFTNTGETLLHRAAESDEKPIGACVEVLIKYGADVNAANCCISDIEDGKIEYYDPATPLDRANTYDISKNIKILKKAGAKTWEELVEEYNIDTSLEEPEQIKMYEERRKDKK
ncbi:ankyrin repeat domain-containing protein [Campylobacter sp. IFREMER_LSEM_CL1904]|uniref:ankyrin repeat domain-containing protein n=1 Tax=unclassified Campylobacter TaxID=2593542 RepID=UPI0021E682BA|nr:MULTISPECIES: ankyrin repeat domain-containing protein [unclassified Campylobacter]MCV3427952.1 ankyrin repeat domain-containing protein [Campylobacter sp. IFREMER_LSEM_CL1904]MCV3479003.1 ankyrin repeat domain-containing protein [Campylobacter sp. CNRCH_2015_1657]